MPFIKVGERKAQLLEFSTDMFVNQPIFSVQVALPINLLNQLTEFTPIHTHLPNLLANVVTLEQLCLRVVQMNFFRQMSIGIDDVIN